MISYMICEEEIKESVLLYRFCLDAEDDGRTTSEAEIKAEIEEYLSKLTAIDVDFDIDDAIETLSRLDLWKDRAELRVLGLAEASEKLELHARQGLSRDYHAGLLGISRT
jgi:hypothetical protein